MLMGGGGGAVIIHPTTVTSEVAGGTANAGYRLNSNGLAEGRQQTSFYTIETWLYSGVAGDYESRATLVSGPAPTTGTLNTWESLSTSRQWITSDSAPPSTTTTVLTIEIRLASTGTVLTSAAITLIAILTP